MRARVSRTSPSGTASRITRPSVGGHRDEVLRRLVGAQLADRARRPRRVRACATSHASPIGRPTVDGSSESPWTRPSAPMIVMPRAGDRGEARRQAIEVTGDRQPARDRAALLRQPRVERATAGRRRACARSRTACPRRRRRRARGTCSSSRLRSELRTMQRISAVALRAVAEAVHGLDHVGGGPEADAQAADVNVDGARVDVAAHLPDLLEQLLAREHAAGVADRAAAAACTRAGAAASARR